MSLFSYVSYNQNNHMDFAHLFVYIVVYMLPMTAKQL